MSKCSSMNFPKRLQLVHVMQQISQGSVDREEKGGSPLIDPFTHTSFASTPTHLELSFLMVLAFPKASSTGLDCSTRAMTVSDASCPPPSNPLLLPFPWAVLLGSGAPTVVRYFITCFVDSVCKCGNEWSQDHHQCVYY